MAYGNSRSVRFQDDLEATKYAPAHEDNVIEVKHKLDGVRQSEPASRKSDKKYDGGRKSLKSKVLSRVFSEDYERVNKKILDPRGHVILVNQDICIDIGVTLEIILTVIRSIADIFYVIQIFVRFRTAYVAPSSRVFGRGELVIDTSKIEQRYIRKGLLIDVIAALPLPQVLIWAVIPNLRGSTMANTKNVLRFIIIFQYLPRLYLIFPLSSQIVKATGVVTETAWAGAAYNLMLYMLASHSINDPQRKSWFNSSNITRQCDPNKSDYPFGIYGDAVTVSVTSALFFNKYFYCLWWGLKNLSALGQDLSTSTHIGEISFAIIVATLGLVLFALLIGNMQTYLQSTTVRLEEWRIRRMDTEQWMHHRQLPQELRQSVRKYDQYKWIATRGVDEEALIKGLPLDLRRDIKRHLCYDLVRRVPLFDQMDERMLDAICERLKPALCTQGTCLVREGDPVNEMLFIIRGNLDSYTTNGGRTGFFNSCRIGPGDFCGEELLTWALNRRPSVILPSSTRTVKAVSEVESFALVAEDLKFVAAQFRRLHSKQLRHKFRFYSHQWRTWAACFIQAAYRRYKKRKGVAELEALENLVNETESFSGQLDMNAPSPRSGFAEYATRWAASRRGLHKHSDSDSSAVSSLQKPEEPDFSVDDE
uniref:Cyclic nucleotide-gated ion channel 15 n=1 Tax=Solanum tuberosum TaxID=4113 RepID=M1A8R1_SOLTU